MSESPIKQSLAQVVINGRTNHMECRRCGAAVPLVLPAHIDEVIKQGNAFAKEHQHS